MRKLEERVPDGVPGSPEALPFVSIPLVDAHVHVRSHADVDEAASHGVLGLRDMGTRQRAALSLPAPGLASAGAALCPARGYGGFLGVRVDTADEAGERMVELKSAGARFVKLVGSGLIDLDSYGVVGPGGFREEEMKQIILRAEHLGLPVAVHANGDGAVRAAVRAGARSIEHGFFLSRETLRMMAEGGVFWVPTVYPVAAGSAKGRAAVDRIVATHLEMLLEAAETGVRLALGTDAGSPGVPFGRAVLLEMKFWMDAGMDTATTFRAATTNGWELCGGNAPVLEEGSRANIVVLSRLLDGAQPLRGVFREGRDPGR